jgi:hypothetical protein
MNSSKQALFMVILTICGCGTSSRKTEVYSQEDRPLVQEKYLLKKDQEELEQLRKDIPEDIKKQNDETAYIYSMMAEVSVEPSRVREQFQSKIRKKREVFDKDMTKERETFTKNERKVRDEFLKAQSKKRDAFLASKPTKERRDDFFKEHEEIRKDYFANEREQRSEFDSSVRERRSNFEDYIREMTNKFNQEHRDYTKRYDDMKKKKDKEKEEKEKERRKEAASTSGNSTMNPSVSQQAFGISPTVESSAGLTSQDEAAALRKKMEDIKSKKPRSLNDEN